MSDPLPDEVVADQPVEHADVSEPGPGLPPATAVESLVNALLESGPEVAEHVVNAARELLLAAQTVVDAAEHAIQEQQELRGRAHDSVATADTRDDGASRVRHLDVAE
jgi:hypothetical protein